MLIYFSIFIYDLCSQFISKLSNQLFICGNQVFFKEMSTNHNLISCINPEHLNNKGFHSIYYCIINTALIKGKRCFINIFLQMLSRN